MANNGLAGSAGAFLTTAELNSIANFWVSQSPTDIVLSQSSLAENNAATALIGSLSTIDEDVAIGDTFTYSLASGAGDADNSAFTILGNELRANESFNFETKSSYTIRVRSTDAAGAFFEKSFTILVTDLDEIAPQVSSSSFGASGVMIAGLNTLAVTFNEPVLNGTDPLNYQLRRAGGDGLLQGSDAPIQPLSVTWNGQAYVLTFDAALGLQEDTYRLTILDTITDTIGNRLDGDNNGSATGHWTGDFVVVDSGVSLISSSSSGVPGNGQSTDFRVSDNGRYLVFTSSADNLVAGDNNLAADIFRKDLLTGEILLVTTDINGGQGNSHSQHPAISADGRYVAFLSISDNLVPGGDNGFYDVYLKDTLTGFITRISSNAAGQEADGYSLIPSISADGKLVAFQSNATNLMGDSDTNGAHDIFIKNWETGSMVRVSNSLSGSPANAGSSNPKISSDGHRVVFPSQASDLVSGDNNGVTDVFAADIAWDSAGVLSVTGMQRVSVSSTGAEGNGSSSLANISPDGRFVDFASNASNFAFDPYGTSTLDVYRKDLMTGEIQLVSTDSYGNPGNGDSGLQFGTVHARYAVFYSTASSLVDNDTNARTDVFVKDTWTGLTAKVSSQGFMTQSNGHSEEPTISADGSTIYFWSLADNLLAGGGGDTNNNYDVFSVPNPLAGASTSRTLTGPTGQSIELDQRFQSGGQLIEGTNHAFDGLNRLQVGATFYQAGSLPVMANDARTIIMPSIDFGGLGVHREITVPASGSQDFVRTVEVLRNLTGDAITQTVRLLGNLGSDAATSVFATSDGDLIVEPTDSWFATDDADPDGGTPAVVHLLRGTSPQSLMPTSVQVVEDNVDWSFEITVNPGDIVRLATFTVMGTTRQQAIDAVSALLTETDFTGHAADYLDGAELASLANFQFDQLRPSVTITNAAIAENNQIGAVVGSLAESGSHGDEVVVYTFVSGEGSQDNDQFSIVGSELRANARFDYEGKSRYSIRVRSTDADGSWTESQMTILITDMLELTQPVQIGDGTAQRSIVNKMVLNFDQAISLDNDAFVVERRSRAADGSLVLTRVTTAATLTNLTNGGVRVTLTFSGALTQVGTRGLVDGNYQLTIAGAKIHMLSTGGTFDADGDGIDGGNNVVGDEAVDNFFALFGDSNGDRLVGISEFGQFRNAFGKRAGDAGYNQTFDIDGDGNVGCQRLWTIPQPLRQAQDGLVRQRGYSNEAQIPPAAWR